MKLHSLYRKLEQFMLSGQGDRDVVVCNNEHEFMYDILPDVRLATDNFDGKTAVIVLTYEES